MLGEVAGMTKRTVAQLTERWETIGFELEGLTLNENGTIVGVKGEEEFEGRLTFSSEQLPQFVIVGEQEERVPELRMMKTIGEGGMGLIQLAVQVPLFREVAVKCLRAEHDAPRARLALLREAWITGLVEHPNVVPVHALGRDEAGAPMFVMKRIEGVSWRELMRAPEHPLRREDVRDHLEWNLGVLMQVCNAVHCAHSKGIVHRDLKPENVMIGEFGEVYLLDWGIAVSLHEDEERPLPRARDVRTVMGTPAYMAPEMVMAQGEYIDERTDVYMLGAILHEIVVGQVRHRGRSLQEIMASVFRSEPVEYGADVPQGLASICNLAMHLDPQCRFADADTLRRALAHFLQHRSSMQLVTEARRGLEQLRVLLQMAQEAPLEERQKDSVRIYSLYSECRFGFRQALKAWEGNMEAREGLREALILMVEHELANEDHKAALLLFNELNEPPKELEERLDALLERLSQEGERLAKLERLASDLDLTVGRRTRSFISLFIGLLFAPAILVFSKQHGLLKFHYKYHLLQSVGFLLATGWVSVWARDTMTKTAVNRRVLGAMALFSVLDVCHVSGGWWLGIPAESSFVLLSLLATMFFGSLGVFLDRGALWSALSFLTMFFFQLLFPKYCFEFGAAGLVFGTFFLSYAWQPDSWYRSPEEKEAVTRELEEKKAALAEKKAALAEQKKRRQKKKG